MSRTMRKIFFYTLLSLTLMITHDVSAREFTPELLWKMGRIGNYDVRSSQEIVFGVTYYDVAQNSSNSIIKLRDENGSIKELCKGAAPKFYADKKSICYIADGKDGKSQLWMMNVDGSNKCQISFCDKDVDDYLFSPDGQRVILIHQIASGHFKKYGDLQKTTGYLTDEVMFHHWDEWTETIPHPFIANFDGERIGDEKDILEGEPYECPMKPFGGAEQLCWSPDGTQVAYTSRKLTGKDLATSTDSDIYLYNLKSGETTNLCKPEGYVRPKCDYTISLKNQRVNRYSVDCNVGYDINPQFSPDGKRIAWQSMARDGYESDRNRLCVMNLKTKRKTYVTETFDSNVENFCWANEKELYFIGVWHGELHVYKTNFNGEVHKITEGQYDYTGLSLADDGLLICSRQSMCEPTDLFVVDPKTEIVSQLTDENKEIKRQVDWGTVQPRWVKTSDDKQMLVWMVLPPNFDTNKKYPTLLFCEGGPQSPVSQFWSYRWNLMIMAANGYVVVCPNRRGLPGFGSEWCEEISTNYGGQCMKDLLTAIDDAVTLPYVDKDRLGCVGASFGGFSCYWLAGHHKKRFKAFIAHDGMYNLEQQYSETEEAWFTNWDLGGAPWHLNDSSDSNGLNSEDLEAIRRSYSNSPHRFVDKWDTPILCIHGEKDYRILASQAMAAYNAAKYRGIDAELLIFPNENHWVLKPQNGILWQRTFFNWLKKYL